MAEHIPGGEVSQGAATGPLPSGDVLVVLAGGGGDTTPPTLSSPFGSATGQTTADIGCTTDESGGDLYYVVTASATQPSATQIINGQDHAGSPAPSWGSQVVAATGVQTIGATGLVPATAYYAHQVQLDAASNVSNRVTSTQFTTDAADSALSGGAALDDVAAAGTLGAQQGTCVVPELRNWAGALQAGVTVPVVTCCRLSDGVQVLTLANQVADLSGALSITNAALLTGTTYMIIGWNGDGSSRFAAPATAT